MDTTKSINVSSKNIPAKKQIRLLTDTNISDTNISDRIDIKIFSFTLHLRCVVRLFTGLENTRVYVVLTKILGQLHNSNTI